MKSSTKYSRLLVGVDGSEASLHALREAFKLSKSWLTVVAVAPFYEGDLRLLGVPKADRIIREPCETALARSQELADEAGAVIQPLCERGEPHERLVELAAAGSRDLIVLGARGHNLLENLLVGSVTRRVIGFTSKDILVVPMAGEIAWEKILLATDGSEYSAAAASRAVDLAQAYGSELKVLSVMDIPGLTEGQAAGTMPALFTAHQGYVDEVTGQAARLDLKAEGFVREGQAFQAITTLAREEKAGLIVMGSHGRTGLTRLLMGSTTEKVIGHAPCPVLVVKG